MKNVAQRTVSLSILVLLTTVLSQLLVLTSQAYAAAGKTTANILKADVGARAVAMSGIQFGADEDSFAQFYNHSFLSALTQKEVGFQHNQFFQGIRQEIFTYAHPTEKYGNFVGGINTASYGQIKGYNAAGGSIGDVSASDLVLMTGWGKAFSFEFWGNDYENLSTGLGLKIIRKTLHDTSAMGFALDMGASYSLRWKFLQGIRLAGAVQNLGPGLKFAGESNPLPRTVRFGIAKSFWGNAFNTGLDAIMNEGGSPYASFGLEYRLLKILALRAGYKGDRNIDKNFTYGVGFENPIFRVDYAFVPFGELGDTHRINVIYRFGKTTTRPKAGDQLQMKLKEAKASYAQGNLIEAYLTAFQIQQIAPWMAENNKFIESIQKDFKAMESSHKKAEMIAQVNAIMSRGEKFFEEGNLINARLEFQAVLGIDPDNKTAQAYIRQISGQFQSFVESFYRNGMIAFAAGDFDKAKEEFEKVLVIKPDHAEAKEQLARCVQVIENKEKEEAVEIQRSMLTQTYETAMEAYKKENYDDALKLFSQILKADPENQEVQRYASLSREILFKQYMDRGQKAAGRGEWETAIKSLTTALSFNSDSNEARSLLQDAQRRSELQKKVLSQNYYKEGLEAFLSGDKKKARSLWQKAADLDPDNEEAKRGLSRIAP